MENGWSWEQKTLVSELMQGMELAKQLKAQLGTSSAETKELLVRKILSSYEKALLILKWCGSSIQTQTAAGTSGVPESPISANGSPQSEDFDGAPKDNPERKDCSKKRKILPRWTNQVRVSSETGLEGSHDDGYSWRKYGQKDILGAKYPRSYYRCTYRNTQNCWATKQVQRSDEDPMVFEVTYRGTHTCSYGNQGVQPPASPEKLEEKVNNNNNNHQQAQEILLNIRTSLRVNTEGLDNRQMAPPFSCPATSLGCRNRENHSSSPSAVDTVLVGSLCSSFLSPATPESSYYSVLPFETNNSGGFHNMQHSESDFAELISANTTASNSPTLDMDFSLDLGEIDPNFSFDNSGFFS